jgi:drug/metabolite transporter (DMT)-like permease
VPSKPQAPIQGVLWMIVTGILFVCVTALVKVNGTRIPAVESAFLRYALGIVLLFPMVSQVRKTTFDRPLMNALGVRGITHSFGVALWFFAMARIPIADVTAMNYMTPVYVTIGAALFLGETLAIRRIMAVLAALVGAVVILRPGFRDVSSGHLAMLITAVFFACSYLLAKHLSARVNAATVVVMLSLFVPIGLLPWAMAVWITPSFHELMILFGVACFATAGHYTMTLAFAAAPVTVTQPVTFLQLIWAVSLGIIVFGEPFDPWVVLGGAIILTSVSFMTWREAVLKKRAMTPPVHAPKV